MRPPEFDHVFKEGRRYGGRLLSVLCANRADGPPRIGFAIARKSVPDAVKRNQIKRLLREHFRLHCGDLGPCDLVFMARPAAADARGEHLHEAIHTCWVQLKKHCAAR